MRREEIGGRHTFGNSIRGVMRCPDSSSCESQNSAGGNREMKGERRRENILGVDLLRKNPSLCLFILTKERKRGKEEEQNR